MLLGFHYAFVEGCPVVFGHILGLGSPADLGDRGRDAGNQPRIGVARLGLEPCLDAVLGTAGDLLGEEEDGRRRARSLPRPGSRAPSSSPRARRAPWRRVPAGARRQHPRAPSGSVLGAEQAVEDAHGRAARTSATGGWSPGLAAEITIGDAPAGKHHQHSRPVGACHPAGRSERARPQRPQVVAERAERQLRADTALHAEGAIELALRVDVHRALQRQPVSEGARPPAVALANHDQLRAAGADRCRSSRCNCTACSWQRSKPKWRTNASTTGPLSHSRRSSTSPSSRVRSFARATCSPICSGYESYLFDSAVLGRAHHFFRSRTRLFAMSLRLCGDSASSALCVAPCRCARRARADELERGFENPARRGEAADLVALDGAATSPEGITKDLEWMKRVGIAGFQTGGRQQRAAGRRSRRRSSSAPGVAGRRAARGGGGRPARAGDDDLQLRRLERHRRAVGRSPSRR